MSVVLLPRYTTSPALTPLMSADVSTPRDRPHPALPCAGDLRGERDRDLPRRGDRDLPRRGDGDGVFFCLHRRRDAEREGDTLQDLTRPRDLPRSGDRRGERDLPRRGDTDGAFCCCRRRRDADREADRRSRRRGEGDGCRAGATRGAGEGDARRGPCRPLGERDRPRGAGARERGRERERERDDDLLERDRDVDGERSLLRGARLASRASYIACLTASCTDGCLSVAVTSGDLSIVLSSLCCRIACSSHCIRCSWYARTGSYSACCPSRGDCSAGSGWLVCACWPGRGEW